MMHLFYTRNGSFNKACKKKNTFEGVKSEDPALHICAQVAV